jgi:NTP pyrophosphatase (non-canonical NTP hydrolase)
VDWSNALAGEVGEACNLTKKAKRDGVLALTAIAKELGDVVIYADHLARSLGLNLRECVIQKFNEVSERVGSHERLGK